VTHQVEQFRDVFDRPVLAKVEAWLNEVVVSWLRFVIYNPSKQKKLQKTLLASLEKKAKGYLLSAF